MQDHASTMHPCMSIPVNMSRWSPAIAGVGFVLSLLACSGSADEAKDADRAPVVYEMRGQLPPADDATGDTPPPSSFGGTQGSARDPRGPELGQCPPACLPDELPQ